MSSFPRLHSPFLIFRAQPRCHLLRVREDPSHPPSFLSTRCASALPPFVMEASQPVYYVPLFAGRLALSLSSAGTLSGSAAWMYFIICRDKVLWPNSRPCPLTSLPWKMRKWEGSRKSERKYDSREAHTQLWPYLLVGMHPAGVFFLYQPSGL